MLEFFDDILIYSKSMEDHVGHLTTILEILQVNQFVANFKKCQFGATSIKYLVVKAMQKWPTPQNIKELCRFLHLTGYYLKFVANYGSISLTLTQLLKRAILGGTKVQRMPFNA